MRTNPLWQALDALGGAATQRDWALALADQWALAGAFLRKTGRVAEELICPKSSENGCSRRIVKLSDGGFRAECGDMPRRCNHLALNRDEIRILTVDIAKLAAGIIRAFDLQDASTNFSKQAVHRLGRHEIRAGVGFPVFLALPVQGAPLCFTDLRELAATPGRKALLVPLRSAVGSELAAYVESAGAGIFELDDVVAWDVKRTLSPRFDPKQLFKSIIETLPGVLSEAQPPPIVRLPAGTLWSSISIDFENAELVMLRGPGVQRVLAPADIGMADQRTGKARLPWIWLSKFAMHAGRMPTGTSSAQKHKQFVSEKLCAYTGIAEDPIQDQDGHYVARFKLIASGLKQGRADQRGRIFADDA